MSLRLDCMADLHGRDDTAKQRLAMGSMHGLNRQRPLCKHCRHAKEPVSLPFDIAKRKPGRFPRWAFGYRIFRLFIVATALTPDELQRWHGRAPQGGHPPPVAALE